MQARLLGLEPARTEFRLRGAAIEALGGAAARQAAEDLAQYARLGGLTLLSRGSPWARSPIVSAEEVRRADAVLDEVRRQTLPGTCALLERASGETGLPQPQVLAGWAELIDVWVQIGTALSAVTPAVYELDLQATCEALAPAGRGGAARLWAALTSARYRAARAKLRTALLRGRKLGDHDLYSCAVAARDSARKWAAHGGRGIPRAPRAVTECQASYEHLLGQLAQLEAWAGQPGMAQMPAEDCERLLDRLDGDRGTLARLPELHRLRASLQSAGLGEFVAAMGARQASDDFAVRAFWYAWLRSVLDHLSLTDLSVGGFLAEAHDKAVREFSDGDRRHIETTSARVRRAYGENAVRARDQFKDQAALVQHQAGLKRRHMPVRDFVRNAADVLLALKPCWAMSPLVVSQLLPPLPYFDVVIFDEASQITPANAVTSILRGRQLVVAGDNKQLPPTAFFVSDSTEDESDQPEPEAPAPLLAGTAGFESILDALGSVLGFRQLLWHYRSRDERLIAFSNAHIYDRTLITFPGIGGGQRPAVRACRPGSPAPTPTARRPRSEAVVDLILRHARERPGESLGVITMGIRHRDQIEERLRQRLRQDPELAEELAEFFDENREERFFVKNLERVQGDERDAIILSIGYGKNARGDLPTGSGRCSPRAGNAASTSPSPGPRTGSRSSPRSPPGTWTPSAPPPKASSCCASTCSTSSRTGPTSAIQVLDKPALNPFEVDVRDTLLRHGLKLTAQYGTSGYWIDFAVQHPPSQAATSWPSNATAPPTTPPRARETATGSARNNSSVKAGASTGSGHRMVPRQGHLRPEGHRRLPRRRARPPTNGDQATDGRHGHARTTASEEPHVLQTTYEAALSRTTPAPPAPGQRKGPRPWIPRGHPIDTYSDAELLKLAQWIRSDDVLRTQDELLQEMMRELGFQRRGKNVVARLTAAITRSAAS